MSCHQTPSAPNVPRKNARGNETFHPRHLYARLPFVLSVRTFETEGSSDELVSERYAVQAMPIVETKGFYMSASPQHINVTVILTI